MKQKLLSRKLWASVAGIATGIGLVVSGQISEGSITIIASVIGYLVAEGAVDVARILSTVEVIGDIAEGVNDKLEKDKEE